jgi:DNA-binding Xre family transcriptional regulator
MSVQYIDTKDGRLVVLPEEEYKRLTEAAEDLEDIALYDAAMRKAAAGDDERVPHEIVKRLVAGRNPIMVWREHRGLKAKELAERAGISAPYLSQLESGEREASLDVIKKIAAALDVAIDDLV